MLEVHCALIRIELSVWHVNYQQLKNRIANENVFFFQMNLEQKV